MAASAEQMKGLFFSKIREKTILPVIEAQSPHYDTRADIYPDTLILHYTACDLQKTLDIFQRNVGGRQVSSHYTIDENGNIYFHVNEDKRAWHAGLSWWQGRRDNNSYSIGIEHVNFGFKHEEFHPNNGVEIAGSIKKWYPFKPTQIQSSINLCREITTNYNLSQWKILGHSDVAPGRKVDPGPLFPWEELARTDIGVWWNKGVSKAFSTLYGDGEGVSVPWIQRNLSDYGYGCVDENTGLSQELPLTGKEDIETIAAVRSFQMHFRQNNISGRVDRDSMEILDALLRAKKLTESGRLTVEEQKLAKKGLLIQ
jgi:N-acetyl-anhydromuramyl-L-alanine amidase AmpD